ncbi:MAG: ATP-binding protein, partial [Sphaerochaetaceae bacterium]|nr:ATP-binding protein [Sphaerochaetaceae bacterium]
CRLTGLKSVDVKTSIRTLPLFGEIFATHDTKKYPIEDEIIRIMGKDNLVRSYRYSIRRIVEGDTQSDILMTLEDITIDEEKKLATIEREKNRMLNQMMAGIAHEVRNPLTGIRNFAQLIPTCYTDPDFMENFTKLVPQEVDRITRLIESLMHFARPPVCNPVPLDITTVVQECSFLAQITVKGYPIEIKTSCDTPAFVFVDHDQIKQAFINIILNSISSMKRRLSKQTSTTDEASVDNLRLEISVHNEDSHVKVVIRDQGEGMSKEVLRQCTDPFYTTKSLGTGLGLALSKQFIRENKGNLIMNSTPGIGTTASIILGKYVVAEEA